MLLEPSNNFIPSFLLEAEELKANPGQWQAYQSKGNCIVLAGPGSGKTKTLTLKIAQALYREIHEPRGLACISYNSECVRELQNRLERLGICNRSNLFVGTIHAFCYKHIILPYADISGLSLPSQLRIAPERITRPFLEKAALRTNVDPNTHHFQETFNKYRRTYTDRSGDLWKSQNPEIANVIEIYENLLRQNNYIDFDDMVLLGLRLVREREWIRSALQAKYQMLVVDEYQDLGNPLHELVLSLCFEGDKKIRLLAVGDPDQSIYDFTGANPELLNSLTAQKDVETVRLQFNYRCGETIVKSSQTVLGINRNYSAKNDRKGTIDIHECKMGIEEQASLICDYIIPQALSRKQGRSLSDIAILYLDSDDGEIIANKVSTSQMLFTRIDKSAPYRKTPLTRWLEDCAKWCSGGWMEGNPKLINILTTGLTSYETPLSERDYHQLREKLIAFLYSERKKEKYLCEWLIEFSNVFLYEAFQHNIFSDDDKNELEKLKIACASKGKISHFNVATFAGQGGAKDHLNLMTLHSSKGLEFDIVIMLGLEQGKLPSWRDSGHTLKEARRRFYVGLTRAKYEVHLLYSGWTKNKYGRVFRNGRSIYIDEIEALILNPNNSSDLESNAVDIPKS